MPNPYPYRMCCLAALFFFTGCASIDVAVDYDPDASFSNLKSYAWLPAYQRRQSALEKASPLVDTYVRDAVDRVLTSKGYRKASEEEKPDFLVNYFAAVESGLSAQTINRHASYSDWSAWRGKPSKVEIREYAQGFLVIDLINGETMRSFWRGGAQARVDREKTTEERQESILDAVRLMFKEFPPK